MPPSIAVFHNVPGIDPKIDDGAGLFMNLIGSE